MEKKNPSIDIEEIIYNLQNIIEKFSKNEKIDWEELISSLTIFYSKNKEKILENPDFANKIREFIKYLYNAIHLPKERKIKRLKEAQGMIERLKIYFLTDLPSKPSKKYDLQTDIKYIKGVGERKAKLLNDLGIYTIYDALYFPPRDYQDLRKIDKIIECIHGKKSLVVGKIVSREIKKLDKMKIHIYTIEDDTGIMVLNWFNQDYIKNILIPGMLIAVYGEVEYNFGKKQMNNPEYVVLKSIEDLELNIFPVYPLKKGLNQKSMRRIFQEAIKYSHYLEEFIPDMLMKKRNLLDIRRRLKGLHFPKSLFHIDLAKKSLKYEEMFVFQTAVLIQRNMYKIKNEGIKRDKIKSELVKKFIENLPFELTQDQKKVYNELKEDLFSKEPMFRLLQGDVGSGKTLVAELLILDNYESGYQAAYMAPTSVLARQQYQRLKDDLEKYGLKVYPLLGEMKDSLKNHIKMMLKTGNVDVVVGTHALIQEDVEFRKLGFVVIDEQHRFGVKQRLALVNKGIAPDVLVMTATPIPRTLAMTLYGDLDVSVLRQMPKGRKKVKTLVLKSPRTKEIERMYDFIRDELKQKNQVFFVYPIIEESEVLELKAATQMYEVIKEKFKDYPVGLLHGRMKAYEKNEIMEKFIEKEIMVLVTTSVIEVGIDVPDATVMVIEHAERFGLSQLHQLRGRVGRSEKQGYCFLIVGQGVSHETYNKIVEFASTTDGFKVAELDLQWRGPGKFFGVEQHGLPDFKFVNISKDVELITEVRRDVLNILKEDPFLEKNSILKKEIERRYGNRLKFLEAI